MRGARPRARVRVNVGGKHFDARPTPWRQVVTRLQQQHGHGVGLFAGRARSYPDTKIRVVRMLGQHLWQQVMLQFRPHLWVAKKRGHANQQFLEEQIGFGRVVTQPISVGGMRHTLMQRHAALNTARHGALLVAREIMAGAGVQQLQNRLQGTLLVAWFAPRAMALLPVVQIGRNARWKFSRLCNGVHQAGFDGTARHAVELRTFRRLRKGSAAVLLQCVHARSAVKAHARKNHSYGRFAPYLCQGLQKPVNRQVPFVALVAICIGQDLERTLLELHLHARCRHMHVSCGGPVAVFNGAHHHAGVALEQLWQQTGLAGA